eukprot:7389797-Prymnesium_polylepis.2
MALPARYRPLSLVRSVHSAAGSALRTQLCGQSFGTPFPRLVPPPRPTQTRMFTQQTGRSDASMSTHAIAPFALGGRILCNAAAGGMRCTHDRTTRRRGYAEVGP